MTREIEITVKLRWNGDSLRLGWFNVGEVNPVYRPRLSGHKIHEWNASTIIDRDGTMHSTREAAMSAVEAAATKAMGGEITQPGRMDAILNDQNERDRFPQPGGAPHDTSL